MNTSRGSLFALSVLTLVLLVGTIGLFADDANGPDGDFAPTPGKPLDAALQLVARAKVSAYSTYGTGVPEDIAVIPSDSEKKVPLKLRAKDPNGMHCTGFVFSTLFISDQDELKKYPANALTRFTDDFYDNSHVEGPVHALTEAGVLGDTALADRVDISKAAAGDFCHFWRAHNPEVKRGPRHSVVILEVAVHKDDEKPLWIKYASIQKDNLLSKSETEYLLERTEGEKKIPPTIDVAKIYCARLKVPKPKP